MADQVWSGDICGKGRIRDEEGWERDGKGGEQIREKKRRRVRLARAGG
jgi:hypothetical protein